MSVTECNAVIKSARISNDDHGMQARVMTVETCDPRTYQLAQHILQDEPCRDDPQLYQQHCHSLALAIQQTVEDWCFDEVKP